MPEYTAEEFVHRVFDLGLIDARQVETVWSDLTSREVETEAVISHMLRKELITNWQMERVLEGKNIGYFYGKYKILYLVGAGTFARVYRAMDGETNKMYALKVLRQRYSGDMNRMEQFLREAKTVMEMKHPNIVQIHDVTSERGRSYMVMDFVEGQNLRDWVKRTFKLSVWDAVRIMIDIARGLDYAFGKGVLHRDMKLSNVLVSSRGRASLVDFGLAVYEGKLNEQNVSDVPNPRSIDYAALERACGTKMQDKRSDIFFCGSMLYQLLTGYPAMAEVKDRVQRLNPSRFLDIKPITDYDPNLPARVVMAVNKCLELNIDARFQTPAELLEELQQVKAGLDPSSRTVSAIPTAPGAEASESVASHGRLEGESHTVMLIERKPEIQDALRTRLKKLGYRVLVIGDPERALSRFDFEPGADCVIFGTAELGVAALNAFNQFATGDMTSSIPAILLVDQRQKGQVEKQAQLSDQRLIITMPLKFKQIRAALRDLISNAA